MPCVLMPYLPLPSIHLIICSSIALSSTHNAHTWVEWESRGREERGRWLGNQVGAPLHPVGDSSSSLLAAHLLPAFPNALPSRFAGGRRIRKQALPHIEALQSYYLEQNQNSINSYLEDCMLLFVDKWFSLNMLSQTCKLTSKASVGDCVCVSAQLRTLALNEKNARQTKSVQFWSRRAA